MRTCFLYVRSVRATRSTHSYMHCCLRIPINRAASENMKKALLKRKKKGKLPEQATEALKIWFDNNLHNPYPSVRCPAVPSYSCCSSQS